MRFLFLIISFSLPLWSVAQTVCSAESSERLDAMLTKLAQQDFTQSSIQETVIEIGKDFLNTPYVEKTLEVAGDEPLVVNLVGLDCTTYLESIVTLSRLAKLGRLTRADYEKELEFLRYRDGKRAAYPSRLHYFSDWIYDNQQKGVLQDITQEIGGVPYPNAPSFMSKHPQYYPQLANKAFIPQIQESEVEIKARSYHYIPQASVQKLEHNIQSGDLIAITISMNNLDISHVGIAVKQNGRIHLMHASSSAKKVVISTKPLSAYLMGNKSQTGIMVCRLQDPE
ncbi:MAG: N-acetylmuramoyl-L-alanine amidase-like domain-containing protein [Bacteroidia bacterium]